MSVPGTHLREMERCRIEALIAEALSEDLGEVGDVTSTATIPSHARGAARLVAPSRRACWRVWRLSSAWLPSLS